MQPVFKHMDKEILISLINENYSTHKIAKTLSTSQTNIRYWLRKYGLNTNLYVKNVCDICETELIGRQKRFCSTKCKTKVFGKNTYEYQQTRGQNRKLELIKMHGGRCCICGYKKNAAALAFHHRDPSNKTFQIDIRKCSNTKWESLLKESNKCDLVCHNCHAELHYPHYSLST